MERIVSHLWFDTEVQEAVELYLSLFEDSKILSHYVLEETPGPEGYTVVYDFELAGQPFTAINGGPYFKFNPSISLTVLCDSKEELNNIWDKLLDGGKELMPLQTYPFSEWYGWVEDKFGLSWQLISSEGQEYKQKIVPSLMFSGEVVGKAKDALTYYTNLFQDGKIVDIYEYERGEANHPKAKIAHSVFEIMGVEFIALDNGNPSDFTFNEAFSLMVNCVTQAEIDYYWEKLSADPAAEQCGWLKDKFGVSWQIVSANFNELIENGTKEQIHQVTQAFLKMKKIEIAELERVWYDAQP